MRNKTLLKAKSGFTLIEVIISMVILAIGLLGLAGMTTVVIFQNKFAADYNAATKLIKEKIDQFNAYEDQLKLLTDTDPFPPNNCAGINSMFDSSPSALKIDELDTGSSACDPATGVVCIKRDNTGISTGEKNIIDSGNFGFFYDDNDADTNVDVCNRVEEINSGGEILTGTAGDSDNPNPPYKFTRFYTVCMCMDGSNSDGNATCNTACSSVRASTGTDIWVIKVYVLWKDFRGKMRLLSSPYMGYGM